MRDGEPRLMSVTCKKKQIARPHYNRLNLQKLLNLSTNSISAGCFLITLSSYVMYV